MRCRWLPPALVVCAVLAWATPSLAQSINAATTNGSATIAAGNTFQTVLAAVSTSPLGIRRSLTIQNNNATDNCWVFIGGGTAAKGTSILLLPGGSYARYFPYVPSDAIQATCASTNDTLYIDTQ
jgi:hypothetical protein